jgi:hypothetical protein
MISSAVSVASTATLVLSSNRSKAGWILANAGSATVYLGGSGVTTATGVPLEPSEKLTSDGGTEYEGDLYAICASGTVNVRVLEWGEGEI